MSCQLVSSCPKLTEFRFANLEWRAGSLRSQIVRPGERCCLKASRGRSYPNKPATRQGEDLLRRVLAKAPVEQRTLSDGRDTEAVLVGMVNEWAEIRGGKVWCETTGSRWAHVSDDSWVIGDARPLGVSTDMCAVGNHAAARTFASGYQGLVPGNAPPVTYWSVITTTEDVGPVLLAFLDRELTGAIACLDWYLQTLVPQDSACITQTETAPRSAAQQAVPTQPREPRVIVCAEARTTASAGDAPFSTP